MATEIKETKLLTAKELADKAGVTPQVLRKLLHKKFNRAGKTLMEGNRAEYRFDPKNPVTKDIIAEAKELSVKPKEPQATTKTEVK